MRRRSEQAANPDETRASKAWNSATCNAAQGQNNDRPNTKRRLVTPASGGGNLWKDAPAQIFLHDEQFKTDNLCHTISQAVSR